MASFLPISRPFLPEEKVRKPGHERMPVPISARHEDRRPSARSAATWFSTVPAFSDEIDQDDDDDADTWCCCEPLNNTERILGWLTCFLGGLILSGLSMGRSSLTAAPSRTSSGLPLQEAQLCSGSVESSSHQNFACLSQRRSKTTS